MKADDVEAGHGNGSGKAGMKTGKSFKLQHPAVAYLSSLREGKLRGGGDSARATSSMGGPQKRRNTLSLLPGTLLGRAERRISGGGGSIQSSMVSETQRSLASLESLISGKVSRVRGSQMQRGLVSSHPMTERRLFAVC